MNSATYIEDNKIKNSQTKSNVCKDRNSSFELLRIIAMIMILFHHFEIYGGFSFDTSSITIPRLWCDFIVKGGKIGVNIFVLISGYFLIDNDGTLFHFKKISKLWGQVFFYSVTIYLYFVLRGGKIFIKEFIKVLFPIIHTKWWFASTYFALLLLSPFINMFLKSISKQAYQAFIIIVVSWCSVRPTFFTTENSFDVLWWFIILYSIAGYIRLYGLNHKFTRKFYFISFLCVSLISNMLSVMYAFIGTKKMRYAGYARLFNDEYKLTTLLIALTLFLTFTKIKIKYSKRINTIASATFGVYLIHDSEVIRDLLWFDILRCSEYENTIKLIPFSICAVIFVFMICMLIEFGRKKVIEKPFIKFIDKYEVTFMKIYKKLYSSIKKFVFGE